MARSGCSYSAVQERNEAITKLPGGTLTCVLEVLGVVEAYCRGNGITSNVLPGQDRDDDFTRESDAGRGPVDFKMSKGFALRALLELKLARSSSLKRNLGNQVKIYADAERCNHAYYVIIQFTEKDCDPDFIAELQGITDEVAAANTMVTSPLFASALLRVSAVLLDVVLALIVLIPLVFVFDESRGTSVSKGKATPRHKTRGNAKTFGISINR